MKKLSSKSSAKPAAERRLNFFVKQVFNEEDENNKVFEKKKVTAIEIPSTENVLSQMPIDFSTIISPVKHCASKFVVDGSPSCSNAMLLKSPSPRKIVQRSMACRNVGFLLKTPEKCSVLSDDELEQNCPFPESELAAAAAAKDNRKNKRRKTSSSTIGVGTNFVRINLRRKTFAPQSRTNFKKKWNKKKFKKRL